MRTRIVLLKDYEDWEGIPIPVYVKNNVVESTGKPLNEEDILIEFKVPTEGDRVEILPQDYCKRCKGQGVTSSYFGNYSEVRLMDSFDDDPDGDCHGESKDTIDWLHCTFVKLIPKTWNIEYGTCEYFTTSVQELYNSPTPSENSCVALDKEGGFSISGLEIKADKMHLSGGVLVTNMNRCSLQDPAFIPMDDWTDEIMEYALSLLNK